MITELDDILGDCQSAILIDSENIHHASLSKDGARPRLLLATTFIKEVCFQIGHSCVFSDDLPLSSWPLQNAIPGERLDVIHVTNHAEIVRS